MIFKNVSGFNDINNSLKNTKDIGGWDYFGHAAPGILFAGVGGDSNTNITAEGGKFSPHGGYSFESKSVKDLDTSNVNSDASIGLYGCFTGRGGLGYDPIAQSVADHFGAPTKGGFLGTKFKDNGTPYTPFGYKTFKPRKKKK